MTGTPLIYRSQPFGFDTAMLAGIFSPARRNNPQWGISAGLLTNGTAGDPLVAVDCRVPHP